MDLRKHIATDGIRLSMGSGFNIPINLKYPSGETQTGLIAQVLYDRFAEDPETGDEIVIKETRISLIKADLDEVITAGDKLAISYPLDPANPTVLTTEMMDTDRAPIDGASIGFITIFPFTTEQI